MSDSHDFDLDDITGKKKKEDNGFKEFLKELGFNDDEIRTTITKRHSEDYSSNHTNSHEARVKFGRKRSNLSDRGTSNYQNVFENNKYVSKSKTGIVRKQRAFVGSKKLDVNSSFFKKMSLIFLTLFILLLVYFILLRGYDSNLHKESPSFVPIIREYYNNAVGLVTSSNVTHLQMLCRVLFNESVPDFIRGNVTKVFNRTLGEVNDEFFVKKILFVQDTIHSLFKGYYLEMLDDQPISCGYRERYNSGSSVSLNSIFYNTLKKVYSKNVSLVYNFTCINSSITFLLFRSKSNLYYLLGRFYVTPNDLVSYWVNSSSSTVTSAKEWFHGQTPNEYNYVLFQQYYDVSPEKQFFKSIEYVLDHICYPKSRQRLTIY